MVGNGVNIGNDSRSEKSHKLLEAQSNSPHDLWKLHRVNLPFAMTHLLGLPWLCFPTLQVSSLAAHLFVGIFFSSFRGAGFFRDCGLGALGRELRGRADLCWPHIQTYVLHLKPFCFFSASIFVFKSPL